MNPKGVHDGALRGPQIQIRISTVGYVFLLTDQNLKKQHRICDK